MLPLRQLWLMSMMIPPIKMINWRELLKKGTEMLRIAGIDDAEFDAYQLLLAFFDGNSAQYMLCSGEAVTAGPADEYIGLIERRIAGEPLQFILGKWDFYISSFFVGEGVLIPRPETEELVERCINIINENSFSVVYDLCTGSGCIGLSIAKECPQVKCYLFELYDKAFSYAKKNLDEMKLGNVQLIRQDILQKYEGEIPSADLIVSNPPYIETEEIITLQSEVLREPVTALDGGEDGLMFYRAIRDNWSEKLNGNGYFAFECGEKQTDDLIKLFSDSFDGASYKDMYGNDRMVILQKK